MSIDGAVGAGHGWRGGERVDRGLVATDLLVAFQSAGDTHRGFVVGFEAAGDLQLNGDLVCALAGPGGGCLPQYPAFDAFNVVGGHQWRFGALRLRVLAGPGYYAVRFDRGDTTRHSFGLGARTDVALRLFPHFYGTVGARGSWVPRVGGQSFVPTAVIVGLRLATGE